MPHQDPNQRRAIAIKAAEASWNNTSDRSARTKPARDALLAKIERDIDPANIMDEEVRRRFAIEVRRAYFADLGRKSWEARRRLPTAGTER